MVTKSGSMAKGPGRASMWSLERRRAVLTLPYSGVTAIRTLAFIRSKAEIGLVTLGI